MPRRIRLIPHDASNSITFFRYFGLWVERQGRDTGKNLIIGNSWNGDRPVPDLLYYYAIEFERPDLLADAFDVVAVVELVDFHEVKQPAPNGYLYYDMERCAGRFCRLCAMRNPRVFGRQLHWSMFPNTALALTAELHRIPRRCAGCFHGEIEVVGLRCQNCAVVIAPEARTGRVSAATASSVSTCMCSSCGQSGPFAEVLRCVVPGDGGVAGCAAPQRVEPVPRIWDYDLSVVTGPLPGSFEIVSASPGSSDVPADLLQPMDFDAFFGHMTLDEQARLLGRENPFDSDANKILEDYYRRGRCNGVADEVDEELVPDE